MREDDGLPTLFQCLTECMTWLQWIWANGGYAGTLVDLVRVSWR
jgi:hypothetical protein